MSALNLSYISLTVSRPNMINDMKYLDRYAIKKTQKTEIVRYNYVCVKDKVYPIYSFFFQNESKKSSKIFITISAP